jgi:CPA2 family monovalent cation:H+ antiporter-2
MIALVRDQQLIANPKSITVFHAGDRIGVIGEKDQIEAVQQWIGRSMNDPNQASG